MRKSGNAEAPARHDHHDHNHCIEDAVAAAERLCSERGLRFTPLRRRVLELVWSSHKPVGAYALLDALRSEALGSAPPTVYRALDFLERQGLAHRIESLNAYVACRQGDKPHVAAFLICDCCHTSREVETGGPPDLIAAGEKMGFAFKGVTIEGHGLCAECAPA